jgi:hypothetical protein
MSADKDQVILGALMRELIGKCQVCGCAGDSCNKGGGETCGWLDDKKTLCSHPRCIQVAAIRRKQFDRDQRRRLKKTRGRAA